MIFDSRDVCLAHDCFSRCPKFGCLDFTTSLESHISWNPHFQRGPISCNHVSKGLDFMKSNPPNIEVSWAPSPGSINYALWLTKWWYLAFSNAVSSSRCKGERPTLPYVHVCAQKPPSHATCDVDGESCRSRYRGEHPTFLSLCVQMPWSHVTCDMDRVGCRRRHVYTPGDTHPTRAIVYIHKYLKVACRHERFEVYM